MANAIGMIGEYSSRIVTTNSRTKFMSNRRIGICYVSASATSVSDPYKTLRIHRNASKSEVKKAFRKLALQYHPDVCRGNNNGVQFHHINEAYEMVMSQLREESTKQEMATYEPYDAGTEEAVMGMNVPDYELWEEWMGWEGAGIRDYTSHINPYI